MRVGAFLRAVHFIHLEGRERQGFIVGEIERLKAISIVESPVRFRIRKIFVLENFLSRV